MPQKVIRRLIGICLLIAVATSAQASLRCAGGLVDEGDTDIEVMNKCGAPAKRDVYPAAVDSNGQVVRKAVNVERWLYGPNNGMYRYLRFVDGRLVQVKSKRQ
ncbi:MAG: hypothetical protein JWP80_869 [Pseudomonas sp.]|nr:hypothetical protein [Pseudomonas sp.]